MTDEYYIEKYCGREIIKRKEDDSYLEPYEILEILNNKNLKTSKEKMSFEDFKIKHQYVKVPDFICYELWLLVKELEEIKEMMKE